MKSIMRMQVQIGPFAFLKRETISLIDEMKWREIRKAPKIPKGELQYNISVGN